MGERKGQNHYYPPDFNWRTHKTLNRYHGVHALRERGAKASEGILTIRFEMPFNVWCLGCRNHIGMSVRYNAEKKKVGMYYTTPIYEFRMKCHLCDNYFTIRTDPKNFDYELVEGVRRQEIRFDPSTIDNLAPVDRTMSLKLASDAMFKAEHVQADKQKLAGDDQQLERLEWIQSRLRDDYSANSILRRSFRAEKRLLNEHRARDQAMGERLSTEIALLPETEADRVAAKRLALSKHLNVHKDRKEALTKEKVLNTPLTFGIGSNNNGTEMAGTSSNTNSADPLDQRGMLMQKLREKSIGDAIAAMGGGGDGGEADGVLGKRKATMKNGNLLGIIRQTGKHGGGEKKSPNKEEPISAEEDSKSAPKEGVYDLPGASSSSALLGLSMYGDDEEGTSSGNEEEE